MLEPYEILSVVRDRRQQPDVIKRLIDKGQLRTSIDNLTELIELDDKELLARGAEIAPLLNQASKEELAKIPRLFMVYLISLPPYDIGSEEIHRYFKHLDPETLLAIYRYVPTDIVKYGISQAIAKNRLTIERMFEALNITDRLERLRFLSEAVLRDPDISLTVLDYLYEFGLKPDLLLAKRVASGLIRKQSVDLIAVFDFLIDAEMEPAEALSTVLFAHRWTANNREAVRRFLDTVSSKYDLDYDTIITDRIFTRDVGYHSPEVITWFTRNALDWVSHLGVIPRHDQFHILEIVDMQV